MLYRGHALQHGGDRKMAHQVFLEVGADGRAMAHVPELPGCIAVGETRDDAVAAIPAAIQRYLKWLARHDEEAATADSAFEVVEESRGFGPFDPGDKAALFAPDREPVTREEVAERLRLMAFSRQDLLTAVEGLPATALSEEYTEGWSIDTILRHVGGAEIWYVTRVAHDWQPDGYSEHRAAANPIDWLNWSREVAAARLRELSAGERSGVFHPTHYTDYPEETWTARKVLRRFLEHEREHRAQIERLLEAGPR
jgi:predicted RNase H-like HicB family nuclease/uncharacterized damage-inducible protein DinB